MIKDKLPSEMTDKELAEMAIMVLQNAEEKEDVLEAKAWYDLIKDPVLLVSHEGCEVDFLDLWGDLFGDKQLLIID